MISKSGHLNLGSFTFLIILSPRSILLDDGEDFVQLTPVPTEMPFTRKKALAKPRRSVSKSRHGGQKDSIRTAGDVKAVMNRSAPIRFWMQPLVGSTISTTITSLMAPANIPYAADPTTDLNARQSKKVYINRIRFRGIVTVSDGTNRVRLMLVRQKTNQAGAFNALDALETNDGTYAYTIDSPANQKRCEVIWDQEYQVQRQSAGAVYPIYEKVEMDVPIHRTVKFDATPNGGSSSPVNNSVLAFVAISDSQLTGHPTLTGCCQTVFKNID